MPKAGKGPPVWLTNVEVRSYTTKTGGTSFRLATTLLLRAGWRFHLSYIERLTARLILAGEVIPFRVRWAEDLQYGGAPTITPITMWLDARTGPRPLVQSWPVVRLEVDADIDTKAQAYIIRHRQPGVLRPIT